MVSQPERAPQSPLQTTTYGCRYVTPRPAFRHTLPCLALLSPSLCEVSVPSLRAHMQRFQSQMWASCDDTSSNDDEHNTLLLLLADGYIAPALLAGLSEVDEFMVALGCRFALDIFTIAQQDRPPSVTFPLPHDPGFAHSWSGTHSKQQSMS